MKRNTLNFSSTALLVCGLVLFTSKLPAQATAGSPLAQPNQNGNRLQMSPHMSSNGPVAPQNNVGFIRQTSFDTLQRNIDAEIKLSEMALQRSRNTAVKKFAQQIITENKKIAGDIKTAIAYGGLKLSPSVGGSQIADMQKAEVQMKKVTGGSFDKLYLEQMNRWILNDQQMGHAAYAMMDIRDVSKIGKEVWDLARKRMGRIEKVGGQVKVKIIH